MARFVYIDETGSTGAKIENQPVLQVVAAIVDEAQVQPLARSMRAVAHAHLFIPPRNFEFHGQEIWNGRGEWNGIAPPQLLAAYEDAINVIPKHALQLAHASIDRRKLHDRYGGRVDDNAYLLALQFLLEKVDALPDYKIIIADESKEQELRAVRMVADMQDWGMGEVPGRTLQRTIDSLHFVRSHASSGVQVADLVAYLMHRHRLRDTEPHPAADAARNRMTEIYGSAIVTWRARWPS